MDAKLNMDNRQSNVSVFRRFPLVSGLLAALALPLAQAVPVLEISRAQPHSATVQTLDANAPFIERRADPWIIRDDDGSYYFIASVPEFDRIELRHAKTIDGLRQATPKTLRYKHETGPMSIDIWAPELHKIDGRWYIYFAARDRKSVV